MKTLLFTIEYPPFKGGIASYYKTTVDYWPKNNEIYVLNNNNNELISKNIFLKWLPAFYQLYNKIKKNKIDHVLVGHILPLGTVTWFLSKILNFNYSVFIHGMDIEFAQKQKRKKFLTKVILRNAKWIICNSRNTKKVVEKFLSKNENKNIAIISPGISPQVPYDLKSVNELQKKYNQENKLVLLTVARLVKRKGQDMVIDIINSQLNKKNDMVYLIAGSGPDEKYLKKRAKGSKNIHFLGNVSDDLKWSLIHFCDIFIMPAREIDGDVEGFGISYLEAGIAKKPVIAGRSGGISDAVVDYETGILCEPESKEDIYGAINELQNNWHLRNELGENAMRRIGDEFSPEKQSQEIYFLINNF